MWSSLPVLLLWMIKDKLDIFDNWRLAAVCRHWRSASACHPKTLHTVGDGIPWIWQRNQNFDYTTSSREIISFSRKCKFVIDRPEFADTLLLCSKQGWALLKKIEKKSLFLMNILTGAEIELPGVFDTDISQYHGSFTTFDGLPYRVFLAKKDSTMLTIKSTCPGDETWTSHTYTGLENRTPSLVPFTSIGQSVYFCDCTSRVTVFNVAAHSSKELRPPLQGNGFYAEHEGGLIFVELRQSEHIIISSNSCGEYGRGFMIDTVFRYEDAAPTLWERLDKDAVMGTSWFFCDYHECIAAKGKGLKFYDLVSAPLPDDYDGPPFDHVVCFDLLTGTAEVLAIPFKINERSCWVDIG